MDKIKNYSLKEKGITLAALILTIVVLMIILGASITTFQDMDVINASGNQTNKYFYDRQKMANEVDELTINLDQENTASSEETVKRTLTLTCTDGYSTIDDLQVKIYHVANLRDANLPLEVTESQANSYANISSSNYTLVSPFSGNSITSSYNLSGKLTPNNGMPGNYGITYSGNAASDYSEFVDDNNVEPKYVFTSDSEGKITIPNIECGIYFVTSDGKMLYNDSNHISGNTNISPFFLAIRANNYVKNNGEVQGYNIECDGFTVGLS